MTTSVTRPFHNATPDLQDQDQDQDRFLWSETGLVLTRPAGQDRSQTKKSVLVLVLQVWCCVVKYSLVTLVVVITLKDTTTFQVLFIVSLFGAWNITTVEINIGVYLV